MIFVLCVANALPHLTEYRALRPDVHQRLARELSARAIRLGGYAATVGDEYLPRTARLDTWRLRRPKTGPVVSFAPPPSRVEIERDQGTRSRLSLAVDAPTRIEIARWAFPGWRALVNGQRSPTQSNRHGSIDVELAESAVDLQLSFRAPVSRRASLALSGLAAAAWLALWWRWRQRR
jgi:hypothetical protein